MAHLHVLISPDIYVFLFVILLPGNHQVETPTIDAMVADGIEIKEVNRDNGIFFKCILQQPGVLWVVTRASTTYPFYFAPHPVLCLQNVRAITCLDTFWAVSNACWVL